MLTFFLCFVTSEPCFTTQHCVQFSYPACRITAVRADPSAPVQQVTPPARMVGGKAGSVLRSPQPVPAAKRAGHRRASVAAGVAAAVAAVVAAALVWPWMLLQGHHLQQLPMPFPVLLLVVPLRQQPLCQL